MAKIYSVLGIVGILILAVLVSGCTSTPTSNNSTTKSYASDIVMSGDTSGNITDGQWNNDPPTEWFITANIESKSNTQYSNITLLFTAYDKKNKAIGKKKVTTYLSGNNRDMANVDAVIKVKSEPAYVTMTVLNATPT